MKYQDLPRKDHVCRQIGFRSLVTDDAGNIIGVSYTGLQDALQSDDDDGLSVTWIEFFEGGWDNRVRSAFRAICATRTPGKKGVLAWGNVGQIIDTSARSGHRVRVLHDPAEGNEAHSLVKQLPQDDIKLLDILATEVFAEFVAVATLL